MLRCHNCGGGTAEVFYAVEEIPTASNILLEDRQAAAAYALGPLELAVCPDCGFVFNHRFEPKTIDYTSPYEESQAYSPTFVAFQEALVDRLVATYDLPDKQIFEIGCGKGAFLEAICHRAGAVGLGIDPAFKAERLAGADIIVVEEFFDDAHTWMTGDLICCRHTLEHIQPVAKFVGLVRESAAQQPGSTVLIEVPDMTRILVEGAFWDVFYEHCSYFTPTSLSWLLQAEGLPIRRLAREFDEQYLVVDASVGPADRFIDTEEVGTIVELCSRFAERVTVETKRWRRRLNASATTVLWGAGSKAVAFLAAVAGSDNVAAVVDINPYKQGSYLPGSAQPVIAPERLVDLNPELVIIMNPIYEEEISGMLAEQGIEAEVASLGGRLDAMA